MLQLVRCIFFFLFTAIISCLSVDIANNNVMFTKNAFSSVICSPVAFASKISKNFMEILLFVFAWIVKQTDGKNTTFLVKVIIKVLLLLLIYSFITYSFFSMKHPFVALKRFGCISTPLPHQGCGDPWMNESSLCPSPAANTGHRLPALSSSDF